MLPQNLADNSSESQIYWSLLYPQILRLREKQRDPFERLIENFHFISTSISPMPWFSTIVEVKAIFRRKKVN
jgi:hypothetical protein